MPTPDQIEAARLAIREIRNAKGREVMDSELAEVALEAAEKVLLSSAVSCGVCGCAVYPGLPTKLP